MKYNIEYELSGSINGASVSAVGKGIADFGNGSYELEISCDLVPVMWDPAFVILMTCDRFMGVCATEKGGAQNIFSLGCGNHVMKWEREGALYDDHDCERGSFRSISTGNCSGQTIYSRSQILQAHFHIGLDEKVETIMTPFHGTMMPFRNNMVLVTTAYSFVSTWGRTYHGYTFYPYSIPAQKTIASVQHLSVDAIGFTRSSRGRYGERVKFQIGSSVRTLTAPTIP